MKKLLFLSILTVVCLALTSPVRALVFFEIVIDGRDTAEVVGQEGPSMMSREYGGGMASVCFDWSIVIYPGNPWLIAEVHMEAAPSLDGIPQTGSGNPKTGKFSYKWEYEMPGDPPSKTFPGFGPICFQSPIAEMEGAWIALHLELVQLNDLGEVIAEETGWARSVDPDWLEPGEFPGKNWATYMRLIPLLPPPAAPGKELPSDEESIQIGSKPRAEEHPKATTTWAGIKAK